MTHHPKTYKLHKLHKLYNKSHIMTRAWALVKARSDWREHFKCRFKYALQDAWNEAKRARQDKLCARQIEIINLENRTRLPWHDQERLTELRRAV